MGVFSIQFGRIDTQPYLRSRYGETKHQFSLVYPGKPEINVVFTTLIFSTGIPNGSSVYGLLYMGRQVVEYTVQDNENRSVEIMQT